MTNTPEDEDFSARSVQDLTVAEVLTTVYLASMRNTVVAVVRWQPIVDYGPERFAADLAAAGAVGVMIPDLPPTFTGYWLSTAAAVGLDTPDGMSWTLANATPTRSGFLGNPVDAWEPETEDFNAFDAGALPAAIGHADLQVPPLPTNTAAALQRLEDGAIPTAHVPTALRALPAQAVCPVHPLATARVLP